MKIIGLDISVLQDKNKTGIAVYTYELIKALLQINKTDKFILFGISTLATFNYSRNIEFKKFPNVEIKIFKMPAKVFRTTFLVWQKLGFPKIENFIGKVDLFHSFNWYMPPQGSGKKVATVFDLTSIIHPKWHDPRTTQLDKLRLWQIAQKADLTVVISKSTKNDFLSFSPKGKVEVIYPSSSELFDNKIDKNTSKILKKYHLEPGYFLSVSTIEPRKNLTNLIIAYLNARLDRPLVLIGKTGWKSEIIMDFIKKHHRKIKWLDFVPQKDLKTLYQQAHCLIYPSYYEGFGLPVLEAMRCGTPVICSKSSSLPEVGGQAVKSFDPRNIKQIQNCLCLIDKDKNNKNKKLRQLLKGKGLQQAKKFSWKSSAQKLNLLYQKLLSQP